MRAYFLLYYYFSAVLDGNIWQELVEQEIWTKVEPEPNINNFGSATLVYNLAMCAALRMDIQILFLLGWAVAGRRGGGSVGRRETGEAVAADGRGHLHHEEGPEQPTAAQAAIQDIQGSQEAHQGLDGCLHLE